MKKRIIAIIALLAIALCALSACAKADYDFADKTYICEELVNNAAFTIKINADGTCEPVVAEGGDKPAEGAASVNPGKYAYIEKKGPGEFKWEVLLMGNGNCRIDETMPSGEVVQHVAKGWTDNGDGTATTGAWEDASANKSDFFAADGTCTWKINADGTCEPVA